MTNDENVNQTLSEKTNIRNTDLFHNIEEKYFKGEAAIYFPWTYAHEKIIITLTHSRPHRKKISL